MIKRVGEQVENYGAIKMMFSTRSVNLDVNSELYERVVVQWNPSKVTGNESLIYAF